jgi:hypothetical protein
MSAPETFEAHTAALALYNEILPIFLDRRIFLTEKTRSTLLSIFSRHICSAYFAGRDDVLRILNADLKNPDSKIPQHLTKP